MNETLIIQLESPPAIIQRDERRADDVRKRLQQLDSSVILNTFELADLLSEAKTENYWSTWKFESFDDYLKKSGFDMSPRQAQYLIQISSMSKLLGINKTSLAKARMSKLKEVFSLDPTAKVLDESTQTEEIMSDIMVKLVEDAPNKSLVEIKAIVKRLKGETEDPAGELCWMNLAVRRDAKQTVVSAIELAQKLAGQTIDIFTKEEKNLSQASALELIAADFLADDNNRIEDQGEAGTFTDSSEDADDSYDEDEPEDY